MVFASFVPLQTYNIIIVLYNSSLKGTILLLVRYIPFPLISFFGENFVLSFQIQIRNERKRHCLVITHTHMYNILPCII